jgi:peptidylprolyl isomerase
MLRLSFIITAIAFLTSCSNTKKISSQTETPMPVQQDIILTTLSGVTIKILTKGEGIKPATGDKITVHYSGKLTDGTKFDSSYDRNQPFSFTLGTGQVIKGWDDAFAMLQVGDKAEIIIPSALGYGSQANGSIPANSVLIFDVELISVKQKITATPYAVADLDTNETKSGLKYIMVKKGAGKQAAPGDNVSVHYTGYLMDGTMFDSSVERGEPISFRLGGGQVIQGWEQGIALLNVGGKARLIIPYALGYGEQGYPPVIPAKATLVFDVELVDVN